MKRFLLFLLTASLVHAQTYDVKVDANGNILHAKLQSTGNPAGNVNFGTGKLLVNGVPVGAGGGGTVTSFSAGDLSPLFTTTETTVTTTPALSFTLSTAPANSFFGNGTGSTAIPTFMSASSAKTALAVTFTDLVSHPTDLEGYGILNAQPLSTNLTTWANVTRMGAFDIFAATPTIANFNTLLSDADVPPATRSILTTVPLTGGGDLSANRTIAINDAAADGSTKGAATFTASDFNATTGVVSLDYVNGQKATSSLPGFLSAADWTTFNAKGTVTSFSAGDLSPLFTTTEATITTTPALSFTLSTAGANTFFGNGTGSTAVPTFMSAATALTSIGAQPLDGDLTSIGAISSSNAIPFRATPNTWGTVKYGAGIQFVNGILSTVANQQQLIPEASKSSASTLNVSGETFTNYDVTGTTNISAITLEEGRTVLLRFTGAGLTLNPSASLLTPGGAPIITAPNGWGLFLGGAGGVVTVTDYQNAAGYSKETFDNIFMNNEANVGFAPSGGAYFSIGKDAAGGSTEAWHWRFTKGGNPAIVLNDEFSTQLSVRMHPDTEPNSIFWPRNTDGTDRDLVLNSNTATLANKIIDASQLVDGTVTLAKQANMATASVLYRKSSGTGPPEINTLATLKTDLGLTGTNSGDQTITLTGDVTGSGTGSFAATIAAGAVTFARLDTGLWDDDTTMSVPSSTRVPTTNAITNFVIDYIGLSLADYYPFSGGQLTGQLIAQAGSTASNSAGIKLTSGALQTTAQAGAFEFLTDAFYLTQTTSATRKSIVLAPAAGPVTISGPTAARTMTVPNANFTAARTDAANSFTGVQTMTSPAITTPAITGLATGSGVASAATASTIATRDASASLLAQAFVASGTAPTCTGATIGTGSKNNAGFVTTSTTGVTTCVVTFSTTAPTGWAISPQNNTTANLIRQTASSTTTATFVGTTVSGDVISYMAMAY